MNKNSDFERQIKRVIWIAVGFIAIVLFVNYLLLANNEHKADIGDMFGVSNALFAGLAFGGVLYTIILQRKELKETREEFIQQNRTLKQQRFENTFFNMLNLQSQIVQGMQMGMSKGREVIDIAATTHLTNYLNNVNLYNVEEKDITPKLLDNLHQVISGGYLPSYYRQFEVYFNHYFRHLYHIYKFIYFSDLKKDEKNFYASLTRAQLSQNELYLIAFNIIIEDYGYPNFTYLVKEYDVLQNFGWESIRTFSHRKLVQYKIETITYPFEMGKPTERNID